MNRGTIDLTGRRLVLNEDFKIANLSGPGAFKSVSPDWFTGAPPWPLEVWLEVPVPPLLPLRPVWRPI